MKPPGKYPELTKSLSVFFLDALKITLRHPPQAFSFLRTVRWIRKSSRIRKQREQQGVRVPPIVIFSVTYQCNLECAGCYAHTLHPSKDGELSPEELRGIIEESRELGVSFFVITGGEPFTREELLEITQDFPEMIFIVFTNGLLIDEVVLGRITKQKQIVPLLSLEGSSDDTDGRRGEGTHKHVLRLMDEMRRRGIFFGASLTLTRQTFSTITDDSYIDELVDRGCRFILYVDFTPVEKGTEDQVLTDAQRDSVPGLMERFRKTYPALFIAVPWDEMQVGGCLSSGRGFIHINAQGDVEPCPFAPFSDANLRKMSLKEALRSVFLMTLRELPELSEFSGGGCALWKNREWVGAILNDVDRHECKQ